MPQALLQPHYRGAVNLKKVDSGVPAAVLRYQANSYQSIVDGDTSSHHYLGLDASLRAGFRRWVFEELARQAIPAILVTHDREDCPPTGRCLAMERWQ